MHRLHALAVALLLLTAPAPGQNLSVEFVTPTPRTISAPVATSIAVRFDRPVDRATITAASFGAFGRWSGPVAGAYVFEDDDRTVRLLPAAPLSAGEMVMVVLSHDVASSKGLPLRDGGYTWQFWTRTEAAPRIFAEVQTLSTNLPGGMSSRPYGGIATDLNGDRWLDLTIVNEDTADLRVFLGGADGSGTFQPMLLPPAPVEDRASPSEPADFNRDGLVDICVANINTATVSVLLGNGDGTFTPHQTITVGSQPRGIVVLDADGDGDIDIVNTNASSSNLSMMLNDGSGLFGAASFFEGGGAGEWALGAADMNEDGLLDLVVGARFSEQIAIRLGNGDGTFSAGGTISAGGSVWMLNTGDVNGDGHDDVATANSSDNTGSILLGTGAGTLTAATTYACDPFPLATDLGDLDGDGDLDWSLSSFSGDWFLLANNGAGSFAFDQELDAPAAASCSLMLDSDRDGDLDMALIDEIADVVRIMINSGTVGPGDIDRDGDTDVDDLLAVIIGWGACRGGPCPADLDGDGVVGVDDLVEVIVGWSG